MTDEREDEHTKDDVTVMQDQTDTVKLEPGGVVKSVDDLDFRERAKLLPDHDTWLERPSTVRGLIIASLGHKGLKSGFRVVSTCRMTFPVTDIAWSPAFPIAPNLVSCIL